MELFERFLEEYSSATNRYTCDEKGTIYKKNRAGEKVIAERYPKLEFNGCQFDGEGLIITVLLSINDREDECLVSVSNTGKIDLTQDDVRLTLAEIYKTKWVWDFEILCTLISKYIVYCVKGYMNSNWHIYAKCGWATIHDIYEFKSVTHRDNLSNYYLQDMFGNVEYRKQQRGIAQLTENCQKFLDFLITDKNLIGIYAYTLHSVLWDLQYRYQINQYYDAVDFVENRDTLFFSVCIYGKDKDKTQLIANLLSNLFKEPDRNWCRVLTSRQHISATSIDTKIDKLKYYSSVPIIVVAPKSNRIIKSTKVLKEIHRNRKDGKLFIYPVYISDTFINVDEMVNFPIDTITLPFPMNDKERIADIHYGAMELLYYFLCFLRDSLKNEKHGYQSWYEIRDDISIAMQELGLSEEKDADWLQDNLPIFLLYVALRDFCLFLKSIGFEEDAGLLKHIYRNGFISCNNTDNSVAEIKEQTTIVPVQSKEYLLCMDKLIKTAMQKNADWMYAGNEPRGNKEKCYYLDGNEWYEHFSQMVQKQKLAPISKRKIVELLKQRQLIKTQNNSSANVVLRNGKYYMAILAKEFHHAVQE